MKTKLKIQILENCVLSILTIGAQTWSLTNRQVQHLPTTQNAVIRSILGIRLKDKILVNNMRKQTGAKNIGYKIKKLKLKYAGNMARENSEKWNLMTTLWTPREYKRKRGRPPTRWTKEILDLVGLY